jgi:phenylpyruvate tautomerase PptA (4-oxalocrotonate tautomerase family)
VLVTGWVREGHPADDTTRLATEIAAAVTKTLEIDVERVLVVIQPSPARFAVEGGRVLPEPGQEKEWLAGS